MNRLWLKIFVAFWVVLIATVVVTVSISALISRDELDFGRFDMSRASLEETAKVAQAALEFAGEEGLRKWLQNRLLAQPFPPLLIVGPEGRELLGRPLPPRLRDRLASGRDRGRSQPRTLTGPDGRVYRMLLPRFRPRMGGLFMRPGARLMFAFVLVLLSGGACLLLARYLTRPIRTFRETGRQIGGGDLTARIGPAIAARRDEFGALARDFDQMAARIEALLNAQQRLMRDVSHELRSPLARLQVGVGLIRQKSGDESSPDLDRVDREAENLNALIGEVLQYSRLQDRSDVTRETTDLTELVADVVADARYEGQANGRDVVFEAGEPILADIDAALVHSAIENIVRNALQHSNAKTTVTLTRVDDPAPAARLEIADDGDGVEDEDLDRIFEPFFTTKTTGAASGAGIGLAIARRAVELHGGFIRAGKGAPGGLVVEVTLPL